MGVEVKWGDETQTILVYEFQDPWDWNDYYRATAPGRAMIEAANHVVVTIIDMSASQGLPPGALTHLRHAVNREHPNLGPVILVGLNRFVQAMSNVVTKVYPRAASKVRFVSTLEEAYAALAVMHWP